MTTTFDGSTGSGPAPDAHLPQAQAWSPAAEELAPDSLLDQLRERVEERDETEPQEWIKEIPKVGIRLVLDPDIANEDFQRWMKAATPRGKGRGRAASANPMAMDQLQLSARALTAQCIRLEIKDRNSDVWRPMIGSDGDPMRPDSRELLRTFSVMDSASLLRKLFGRDAKVIDAGQELLQEAGYLGDDADEDDPA